MRCKALLSFFLALLSGAAVAKWEKINDIDYTWGPFKIYNISLFTETGEYKAGTRPIMLTLKYSKPVDGRDFAISVAKSWTNLGITLSDQDVVIDRLRKILPDIKSDDRLSYIALADKGYFVLNNQVIEQEFDQAFNNAMLAIWLDPKVEFSQKLITKKIAGAEQEVHHSLDYPQSLEEVSIEPNKESILTVELSDDIATTEQAVDSEQQSTKLESTKPIKSIGVPSLLSPITKSVEPNKVEVKEKVESKPLDAEKTIETKATEVAKEAVNTEHKSVDTKAVSQEKQPEVQQVTDVKAAVEVKSESPVTENKSTEVKATDTDTGTKLESEKNAEAVKAKDEIKEKEATTSPDKQSKEEVENPEKEIIPEMDPTPDYKLPLS
ncbi:hypothetical protein NYR60_04550 [Actinobacillus genomosp. 2]|uniref:hypothetical protein n=1 Tax=Actinobacillus genomosp. 2 TaxID=230709 RepID=UPI002441482E|nr:hypothetical protein [Actinobacillus genomosp. 2]WGE32879.1 hypothetical protein NYR60_04550 [Actinobacillus genomosp. 2]